MRQEPWSMIAMVAAMVAATASPEVASAQKQNAGLAPLSFAGLSLQQAQDDAVAQSPDVATARARVTAAQQSLGAAKAGFGPSLVAQYALNPQAGALPNTTVTQTAFNLGVQATLLAFAQYLPLLYQAEAVERGANADEVIAERAERIKVSGQYFAALKASAALGAREETLALATAQLEAARKRYKAGDAPRIDVIRAQVALSQALAAREDAQAADDNALQALSLETSVPVAALTAATPVQQASTAGPLADPQAAVRRALAARAELTSARENVASASSALGAARVAALPAITVSAGYEHGTDVGQYVQGPTINASFELPFNGSQSAHVSDATAALAIAREQLRSQERQVTLEVSAAVRDLQAATRVEAASTSARQAAEEELNATQIGYRAGSTSSLERAAAGATYADARLAELSAIYDEELARATVELELGP
ncbi:MAG: TolC family protein [Candidatus Eremiobacteraeota bacterium]|nr:TolC family protein [Candidatus Eremiobacteraeota bacterium]